MAADSDHRRAGRIYVFAYGSLMAPSSVRETLRFYDFEKTPPLPATLLGYRKRFSAIQENLDGFATVDGRVPPYVAYLNVERAEQERALGLLVPVSPADLALLEAREEGYACVDVTSMVRLDSGADALSAKDLVYVFSFPGGGMPSGENGEVGFGADYAGVIARICADLDIQFACRRFASDFEAICSLYSHWPRLVRSNPRSTEGYQ